MKKAIIFDFDGVIIQSQEHTIQAFQKTLVFFHKRKPEPEAFKGLMGMTISDMIKALAPDETDKSLHEMLEKYKEIADSTYEMIQVLPHAKQVIKSLSKTYFLGIVSSRRSDSVHKLLLFHNLSSFFSVVIAKDEVSHHKPHPEGILKALKYLQVKLNEAIYIGDQDSDIIAAHNAGLQMYFYIV